MRKNFFKKILFLVSIFMLLSMMIIFPKDKDDKDKDKKDKKIKDEKIKIKDEDEEDYAINIIKSDIVHSEKVKDTDKNIINNKETTKIDKIISISKLLEELLGETEEIKRDIKISTSGSGVEDLKQKYYFTKSKLDIIIKEGDEILGDLDKEDKDLIEQQRGVIQKSNKKLIKIFPAIENNLNKEIENEDLFNKMKVIEQEMQILYRQYRAIEWIFLEK